MKHHGYQETPYAKLQIFSKDPWPGTCDLAMSNEPAVAKAAPGAEDVPGSAERQDGSWTSPLLAWSSYERLKLARHQPLARAAF